MGWPDWLDQAEANAKRDDTCVEHLMRFERCLWFHEWRKRVGDPYFWAIVAIALVAGVCIGFAAAVLR